MRRKDQLRAPAQERLDHRRGPLGNDDRIEAAQIGQSRNQRLRPFFATTYAAAPERQPPEGFLETDQRHVEIRIGLSHPRDLLIVAVAGRRDLYVDRRREPAQFGSDRQRMENVMGLADEQK